MIRLSRYFLLLVVLMVAGAAAADAPLEAALPERQASAVDAAVQKEMERQGLVGVAVGVVHRGHVAYLKGFGLADREQNRPVTTATVFNWASNSKPVAGVLAMQLVERQRLDLDADVRRYVPEFPEKTAVITTRHLLCHQSGLPHYSNGKVIPTEKSSGAPDPFSDPIAACDKFNQSPLLFEPGTKTSYSSYAYVLLSAVIQRAGEDEFVDQVTDRIIRPLKLTSFQWDVAGNGQPEWTVGYRKNTQGQVIPASEEAHAWKQAAGGFKSNIADFARWSAALLNRQLVSAEAEQQMWTRQKLADGSEGMALGFAVDRQAEVVVSHNGGQPETATRMVLYPEEQLGIVVLCNSSFANVASISAAIRTALKVSETLP